MGDWADVAARLKFYGMDADVPTEDLTEMERLKYLPFSSDTATEAVTVREAIGTLYLKSPTMAAIIDTWITSGPTGSRDIYVYREPTGRESFGKLSAGQISISASRRAD